MVNYQNSKIYKIIDNTNNNIYIGSTTLQLNQRLGEHKRRYTYYLSNNENKKYNCSCYEILKNNNYKIVLIEELNCKDKNELRYKERYYINSLDCINKIKNPIRSIEEKKEYEKKWVKNNPEKLKEIQKTYYEKVKNKLCEKRKEKIICECGCEVTKVNISIHRKSNRHKLLMEQLE